MNEAITYAKQFGDVPVLIIVLLVTIALLLWIIRQMVILSKSIKELECKMNAKTADQDEKISHLQQHYVTKEDMFQQFGGWRTEINKVSDQILHLTELIAKER